MASVDTQNNQNDPNNPNVPQGAATQQGQSQTNQPATTGGAGAVTSTGAGNVTGQVVGTNAPSQPFQNIASYLSANAPQSAQLAQQVADSVSQPISQTQNDIANSSQSFTNAVNTGYTPENSDLISQVAQNPTAVAANPNNVSAFQSQLNDTYSGPTDFTTAPNYSTLESEIANAQALGTEAQTPTGIQTLLQGVEGPTTAGINNLDTLLLAQNPENAATIAAAGAPATTTNNALGNLLTSDAAADNAAAQTAIANAQSAATGASGALNTAATNIANPIDALYNQDVSGTQSYQANLNALISAIASGQLGNLTSDQMAAIGVNPALVPLVPEYTQFFPTQTEANLPNTSLYYTAPPAASLPTSAAQVETPEQAAAIAALQELNGGNNLSELAGLSPNAPGSPYAVPTDMGRYNNVGLAEFLYGQLEPDYLGLEQAIQNGNTISGIDPKQLANYLQSLSSIISGTQPPVNNPGGPIENPVQPPNGGIGLV